MRRATWTLSINRLFFSTLLAFGLGAFAAEAEYPTEADTKRLEAVTTFADKVLRHGRDRFGDEHTPLFADGLNVDTLEPVRWVHDGEAWIPSNLASQQNLLRTLVGLSRLTGDDRYRDAAHDAVAYHFDHLTRDCGLLQWGGHRFVDLATMNFVGEQDTHELKNSFPYYEFLWEVNPDATKRYLKAFWNAHIIDWPRLDMNRHGRYDRELGALWDSDWDGGGEPFFEGMGLTFINTGSDLIYGAGMLYALSGDEDALRWGLRLAGQYVRARHPETQLGVYQYSQPRRLAEPPSDPSDPRYTYSTYGDRAKRQFGPEFGEIALEGNYLASDLGIYSANALIQLQLAERLGKAGEELLEWTHAGLRAYAKHAYIPETNELRPMWTDGTDLTGYAFKRFGYYGSKGRVLERVKAGTPLLRSYALGYRLTGDEKLWAVARGIARGNDLGDLGEKPGEGVAVNLDTSNNDPVALFAVLDLYRATPHADYRTLARRIGDNIVATKFHHGFFLPSERHVNANFDALEPLALVALDAILRGAPDKAPPFPGGRGYIHGPHDGHGRTTDGRVVWPQTRD